MKKSNFELRPTAVADYLRHRFRIQPGEALCIALGQPDARDNYQALTAWVTRALARHRGLEFDLRIQRIEVDLCVRMCEAGIIDQFHDTFPVPVGVIAGLWEPRREPCRKEARTRHQSIAAPAHDNLLNLFTGSDAHD